MAADFRSGSALGRAVHVDPVITAPAGIQDGDSLLIIFEIGAGAPPVPTPPVGFSLLPNYPVSRTDGGFTITTYAWGKVASGESGDYTVVHTSSISEAYMLVADGAVAVAPFNPAPTSDSDNSAVATAPGLITTVDESLIVWWVGAWNFGLITPPAGATPTFISRYDLATGANLHVATGVMTPAGATGNKDSVPPASPNPWASGLIAIEAAAAPPAASVGSYGRGDGSGT